jgi:hypothetical protein
VCGGWFSWEFRDGAGVGSDRPDVPGIEMNKTWPHMSDETAAQLVAHLTSPIGWWRDTAQRLLVLKQDKSVVPALQQMTRSSSSLVGRFHAMWTLEDWAPWTSRSCARC